MREKNQQQLKKIYHSSDNIHKNSSYLNTSEGSVLSVNWSVEKSSTYLDIFVKLVFLVAFRFSKI